MLQLLLVIPYGDKGNLKRQIKNRTFWVENILIKTWSVIRKLFLLNCIFHYISNSSEVFQFYLTSFFNMKSWRVKFINFLGDFLVHYAALLIKRTINNNYMALLMALHHTHDGFWHIPLGKIEPSFLAVRLKKNQNRKDPLSILLKNFKFYLSWTLQQSTLNMCGYYFFLVKYKLVK